ncbi:MAG: DUF6101 family protein [Mesorhizobium sp.]
MTNAGLKPVWAGQELRLDPFHLPQVVSYATRDDDGDVTFAIDHRRVMVKRVLEKSGLPVTLVMPPCAFRGVAARAMEDGEGNVTVTLELMHSDPALSVPLLVAYDLDDVAADWRAWSEAYKLPMMIFEADGVARTLEDTLGMVRTGEPKQRRKRATSTPRRSRFSARRKYGNLGMRLTINGEEIIARD